MFSGSLVALITPFKNGKVDERRLIELIEWHIRSGTHGIVPCGTTGESATLSHEEHTQVIKLVVEVVKKRVPVVAGTGSNSTAEAIRLTREAQEVGANGALMISPYYNRPTQEGIYQHFKAVADAVPRFPIVFYNIPGRTASNIEPSTMARLAELDNIVGVKEAAGSIDQVLNIVSACEDKLAILSGEDSLTFSMMSLGGKGVISTAANVVPREMADLANACLTKQWEKAAQLQIKLLPLIRALFIETNPIPAKTALSLMGKCELELRLPLVPMAEANQAKLKTVLREYRLIG
ncbi:MAG TPA: 4-hydroxy-tetrahydrodipicolinate synthase [Candidatus Binatia bacterium]|jgi:4-hydroxy-tetrahydrodipicolinate synthase|nr:4-hydroxy-tetrahydrodipicolinate synthase [Candidatus Binatia bacterium]